MLNILSIIIMCKIFGGIFMNISKFRENTDIKNILIQMSDKISELDRLIANINVLRKDVHTCLVNQNDLKTQGEWVVARRDCEVSGIKSGMIREFVIRANERINKLVDLSDKSIDIINHNYK